MEESLERLEKDLLQEINDRSKAITLGQCDSLESYRIKCAELHILREIRVEISRILTGPEEDDA